MVAIHLRADSPPMLVPFVAAFVLLQLRNAALLVLGIALRFRLDLDGLGLLFYPPATVVELR